MSDSKADDEESEAESEGGTVERRVDSALEKSRRLRQDEEQSPAPVHRETDHQP